jgi:hypothetical protein
LDKDRNFAGFRIFLLLHESLLYGAHGVTREVTALILFRNPGDLVHPVVGGRVLIRDPAIIILQGLTLTGYAYTQVSYYQLLILPQISISLIPLEKGSVEPVEGPCHFAGEPLSAALLPEQLLADADETLLKVSNSTPLPSAATWNGDYRDGK